MEQKEIIESKHFMYNSMPWCFISLIILVMHTFVCILPKDFWLSIQDTILRESLENLVYNLKLPVVLRVCASVVFFIAAGNLWRSRKIQQEDIFAQLAQFFSFLTFLPWFFSLKDRLGMLIENPNIALQWIETYRKQVIFLAGLFTVLLFVGILFAFKNKQPGLFSRFYESGNEDKILNGLCLSLIFLHIFNFFWRFAGLGEFLLGEQSMPFGMLSSLIFFICLILLVAAILYCRKHKENGVPLMFWFITCLCAIGMIPPLAHIGEMEVFINRHWVVVVFAIVLFIACCFLWNLDHTKIKEFLSDHTKEFFIAILIATAIIFVFLCLFHKLMAVAMEEGIQKGVFLLIYGIFIIIALLFSVMLIFLVAKFLKKMHHGGITNTTLWRESINKIQRGTRSFLYGYLAVFVVALMLVFFLFFQWSQATEQIFQQNDPQQMIFDILTFFISALFVAMIIIFAFCQMIVCLVRTLKEVEQLAQGTKKASKSYFLSHSFGAFITIILSFISWMIYIHLDFTDEDAINVAGESFRFFAFPVIALLWYAIMFYLLMAVLGRKGSHAKNLYHHIRDNAYDLAESFVYSIFAPFRLFFSFFDILAKAMLNEEKEVEFVQEKICIAKKSVCIVSGKAYAHRKKKRKLKIPWRRKYEKKQK